MPRVTVSVTADYDPRTNSIRITRLEGPGLEAPENRPLITTILRNAIQVYRKGPPKDRSRILVVPDPGHPITVEGCEQVMAELSAKAERGEFAALPPALTHGPLTSLDALPEHT